MLLVATMIAAGGMDDVSVFRIFLMNSQSLGFTYFVTALRFFLLLSQSKISSTARTTAGGPGGVQNVS